MKADYNFLSVKVRYVMFFSLTLYFALGIFVFGLLHKISTWFRYSVGIGAGQIKASQRLFAAIKGIVFTILSPKILILLKVFILDVLFQRKIFQESLLRWSMHMCIFGGFVLLLLMHTLEKLITCNLFSDYSSTLNPFLFLRNLFGLMVMAGLAISVYRRHILKIPRLINNAMDHYMIIILAIIMISGVLLESVKIVSYSSYQEMVEEYSDEDDEESLQALESYWVHKFGVVSPNVEEPFDANILVQGKELHEMSCAGCHSRPQWAFLSYGVAKISKPVTVSLDKADIPTVLWYLHFLACFVGLAYLPFSKMFHIFAGPLSLLANAVMESGKSDPANIATRQVIELDACTHCGSCTVGCSVGVVFEEIPNQNILPSEKIAALKALAAGKSLSEKEIEGIQEGLYLCTNCYHCTAVCPVGINLQELWFKVREDVLQRGYPELLMLSPLSLYRGLRRDEVGEKLYRAPLELARKAIADECQSTYMKSNPVDLRNIDKVFKKSLGTSAQGSTFSYCFTCTTCSMACPVVRNFENPRKILDLLPHQIIHAAALGMPEMVYQSNMLWTCLGCYQCQEHCPQGVRVTDVLYEIKKFAISRVKEKNGNVVNREKS